MENLRASVKNWGVIVVVVVWVVVFGLLSKGGSAQGTYVCLGGCYNQCILLNGQNPSQRLPCYATCAASCIADPSNSQYYCQLGCSLALCIYLPAAGTFEGCLENCSNNVCNLNT